MARGVEGVTVADRYIEEALFWLARFSSDPAMALTSLLLAERLKYDAKPERIILHPTAWTIASNALRRTQKDHERKELLFFGAEIVPSESVPYAKVVLDYGNVGGVSKHEYEGLA